MNIQTESEITNQPRLAETISVSGLDRLLAEGQIVQLVDVRSPAEFREGHMACAVNIPMEELPTRLKDLRSDLPTVLVCQSGRRAEICRSVISSQLPNHAVLAGGTSAWRDSGHDLIGSRTQGLPLMRQVQLTAGTMALAGAALAQWANPNWIWLSGFVGAGLIVAGTTGFCGMANLLAAMPWNRR